MSTSLQPISINSSNSNIQSAVLTPATEDMALLSRSHKVAVAPPPVALAKDPLDPSLDLFRDIHESLTPFRVNLEDDVRLSVFCISDMHADTIKG